MNGRPPIIDRPHRLGRSHRLAQGAFTAGAWALYFYLWAPLLTVLAWAAGVRTAYVQLWLARQDGIDLFLLAVLPLIALVCATLLIGWAEYNRVRFADADRRRRRRTVGEDEVDARMGAADQLGGLLRYGRITLVELDRDAVPIAVRVLRHS